MESEHSGGSGFSVQVSILLAVLISVIFASTGCRDNDRAVIPAGSGDPSGSLVSFSGCKTRATLPEKEIDPSESSCVRYRYDGNGTLFFDHVNAGFNCCHDMIHASISIEGETITVSEAEDPEGGLCDCLCLFDLHFVARNLEPGAWTIKFVEPYIGEGDEVIEFTADLLPAPSGEYCVARTRYPWGP